jgi:hypothetical protein
MSMADEPQSIRGINWRETFPFTHIFRAFRVAVHPSKLVLGLIALLSLYVGGRVLDSMWSPQSLAVPGEVQLYERMVRTGGTSDEFATERRNLRLVQEEAYADRLVTAGIVTDENEAARVAQHGGRLGDFKDWVVARRNERTAAAKKDYDAARSATTQPEDSKQRNRTAEEAYRAAVRGHYTEAYTDLRAAEAIRGHGIFRAFFSYEAACVNGVIRGVARWNWLGTADDEQGPGVVRSVINFFRIGPIWLMRHHPLYFILFTLWFLTIWAIFGGAIARIAAIHVARDEKLSVRAALGFSLGKFLSFVSAPLIPLVIVLVVGMVPLIAGLLSSIPGVGVIVYLVMTALFVLILAAGFVMTLVLLGTFGGFNLMYPTIAVEGSDSFDAISRSFSYVYARPWRMLFYTIVAIIYGALCYLFVKTFIWLMLSLTHYFVGAGFVADAPSLAPLWTTMWPGPQLSPTLSYDIDFLTLRVDQDIAAFFLAFWVYLVIATLGAFVISFYFSANTIIYFLLRNDVDATEMDDVYLEQSEEDFTDTSTPVTATATQPGAVVVDTAPPGANPPPAQASDQPPPT